MVEKLGDCPFCSKPLTIFLDDPDRPVAKCLVCLGQWYSKPEYFSALFRSSDLLDSFIGACQITPTPHRCPSCPSLIDEIHFSGLGGVDSVSHCQACGGFWIPSGQGISLEKSLQSLLHKGAIKVPGSEAMPTRNRRVSTEERAVESSEITDDSTSDVIIDHGNNLKKSVIKVMSPGAQEPVPEQTVLDFYQKIDYNAEDAEEDPWIRYLFSLLSGFPVKINHPCLYPANLIYFLMLVMVASYLAMLFLEPRQYLEVMNSFAFSPSNLKLSGPDFTLITHLFLHKSLFHLGANIYLFWLFGSNLYDILRGHGKIWGPIVFVLLLTVLTGVGVTTHYYLGMGLPLIGASALISGIMGAYWRVFPRSLIFFVFVIFSVEESAGLYFMYFIFYHLVLAFLFGLATHIMVSWQAQLASFLVGYFVIPVFLPYSLKDLEPNEE